MSQRYRTVALQAVAVLILAALVFVVFLRPTDLGPLSGIDAPGGRDGPIVATGRDDGKKAEKKGNNPDPSRNTPRAEEGQPRGTPPAGPGGTDFISSDDDGGPTDHQYINAAALLMERVEPPPLRDTEPSR